MVHVNSNNRPAPDKELVDIADYILDTPITSNLAYETARYCLMDALGCAILTPNLLTAANLINILTNAATVKTEPADAPVAFMVKQSRGATYLFAVGMREKASTATFALAVAMIGIAPLLSATAFVLAAAPPATVPVVAACAAHCANCAGAASMTGCNSAAISPASVQTTPDDASAPRSLSSPRSTSLRAASSLVPIACPTCAIQLTPEFEMCEYRRQNMVYEKEDLLIDGTGKDPDYNFYRHAGIGVVQPRGSGDGEQAPFDPRSLMP